MAEKSQSPLPPSSSTTTSELKFLKNVREANTIRQKLERAIRDFATDENIANLKISKDDGIKFIKNGNLNIPRYENNLIYVDPENPHIFCTNRRNKKKVEFSLNEKENLPVILTHSEEEKNVTIYACLSALYVVTEEKSGYQKPYFRNYTYGCLIKLSYMNEDGNVDKETFRLYDLLCGKYYAFKHNEETTTTTTTTLLEEIENKNLRLKEIARDLLKQKHDDETLKPENSSLKLHFNEINFSTHQVKTTTTTEMRGDDGDDSDNDDDDDDYDDNGDKVLITPFEISDYKIGATKLRIDEKFIGTSISLTIVREFETREKHNNNNNNNTNTTNIKGLYSDSFFKDEGNLGLPSIFTKGSCLSIYEDIRKLEKKQKNLNTGGNLEKLIENFLLLNKSELKDEKKKQSVSDGVGGGGGGSGCRMTKTKRIVCGHLLLTFSIEDLKTPSEEEPECLFVDPENIQIRLLRNEVIPKLLDNFKIILDSPLNHTCLSYALNHIKNFSLSKETEEHVRENLENEEENTDNRKNKYTKSGKVYEYLETFRLKYSFFDISPMHSPDMENKYFFLTNSSPRAYLNSAYIIGMNSLYLNTSIIIHDPRRNNRAYKVIPKREHRPPGKNDAAAAAADSDSDDDGDDEDNGNKSSNNLNNDNRGIGRNDDEEDHKKSVFLMKIKNSKVDNYMAMMIRYLISFVKTINFESINDEVKIKIPLEKENNEEGLEVLLQFSRKPISILDSRNIDRTVLAAAEKALNECFIPYVYDFSNNIFPKTSMFEFIKDKIEKIKEDMKSICKSGNKIEELVRNHNKNGGDINKMKKCAPSTQNTSKEELIKTKATTTGKKRKRFESNDDRATVNGSSGSGNDDKGKKRFRPSPENDDMSSVVAHAESLHQHPHSNTNYKKSENNKSASSPNRSKTAMKKNNHNNNNKTGQPFENKKNESITSPLLSNFKSIKKGSQGVNSKLLNKDDSRVVIMKDGDGNFPAAAAATAAEKETVREKQKYKKQQQQQHQHQPHLPKLSNDVERRKVNNNYNIPQQKGDGILTDSLEINGGGAHCQSSLITSTISITNNYSNGNNIRACAGKGLRGKEKSGLAGYVDSYPHNVFEENIKTPISPLSSEPEETNNKSIGSKDIYSFDNDVYCGELDDIVVAQLQKKAIR